MSKVIVAGSINMDIVANSARHPKPGETIPGKDLKYFPGGKGANQAVAAAQAGAQTLMCGAVGGDDFFTDKLLDFLKQSGVDTTYVVEKDKTPTGTALVVVAEDGENTIVVVPGANGCLGEEDLQKIPVSKGDVLVGQYEVPISTTQGFFLAAEYAGVTCVLNPAPAMETPKELLNCVDVLVVNESELAQLSGSSVNSDSSGEDLLRAMTVLKGLGLKGSVVTTLGPKGVLALVGDKTVRVPGYKVNAVDTTGAGDCFVGCLSAELASGSTIEDAIKFANAGAALSVQVPGAGPSMPKRAEIEKLLRGDQE